MSSHAWQTLLVVALLVNAVSGFGYRVYRLGKGGPMGDVVGQALLGVLLVGLAIVLATGGLWARWPALGYGLLFAVVVMPVWTLAVLIPLPPRPIDYAFASVYWFLLLVIAVAALAL